MAVKRRSPERRSTSVVECIGVRAMLQEVLNHMHVSLGGCLGECGVLSAIHGFDVVALVDLSLQGVEIAIEGRFDQLLAISVNISSR